MSKEDNTDDTPQPDKGDEGRTFTQADLDRIIEQRLAKEKAKFSDYDDLRRKAEQLAEIENASKTETEKLREELDQIRAAHAEATAKAIRAEVAISKGLTAAQAKRLVGSTLDELEADADEILEAFPTQTSSKPPSERPSPDLRGGTDPTDEPLDLKALVDSIPPTA